MTKDQVLHVDDIVGGPSLHDLSVSLTFEQFVNGPKPIPVSFNLQKGIWAVQGSGISGGGMSEFVVVTGMIRYPTRYNVWKVIGCIYNPKTFAELLAVDFGRTANSYFMFEAYYDVGTRTGTVCFGVVPCEEAGRSVRSLPRWE